MPHISVEPVRKSHYAFAPPSPHKGDDPPRRPSSFHHEDPDSKDGPPSTPNKSSLVNIDLDAKPQGSSRCENVSRVIVENNFFVCFTMVLTIYALLADDFRLMFTNAAADPVFNGLVITCILVFGLECILSVYGKPDYLGSFFFWLDVISTISLVLDITFVADSLYSTSQDDSGDTGGSEVRGGRAAKIGAKAGRVVRVLRLVRILKLWKAYYEAKARSKAKKNAAANPGEDDEWDEEDVDAAAEKLNNIAHESHVGRKLSENTTRKVIVIIMAMMLGLQILQADETDKAAFSADYGADMIWQKFLSLVTNTDPSLTSSKRLAYETALLRYTYYHNWFAYANPSVYCPTGECADDYYSQLFYIGIMGEDLEQVNAQIANATIQDTDIEAFEDYYAQVPGIFNYGYMPHDAHEILKSEFTLVCDPPGSSFYSRGISLLEHEIGDLNMVVKCPSELRSQEVLYVYPKALTETQRTSWHLAFYFDLRRYTRTESMFNVISTLYILVLLVIASLGFSQSANKLIIHPVERMIKRVESIRESPLIAMKMADEEFKAEEVAKARMRKAKQEIFTYYLKELVNGNFCSSGDNAPMETVILEKTIIKLGSLLALGFGEAGANIIGHNMKGGDTAGVNAMIPGTRVDCIIGVVRIRDFSVATEVLQSKIMTFVNQIAEVVHGVVNELHGAPNRNSGENFLVIWRMEPGREAEEHQDYDPLLQELAQDRSKSKTKLAGLSIVAFAKILGGLHRSPLLATYRGHPGLQYRLGTNCRVNLSFGLHAGWAIEGAVGSEFKIDASYLSPNVSIATSVERATQTYGVSLMVAQSVVELCEQSVVSKCRLIDRVIITGSSIPMEVYCVDLDYHAVKVDNVQPLTISWNTRNRFKVRQYLERERQEMDGPNFKLIDLFESDPAIQAMRQSYTEEFFQLFNMGYQNYSQGEWQVARRLLNAVRAVRGGVDGPSFALLRFMEQHNLEAPKEWQGVRELVFKIDT